MKSSVLHVTAVASKGQLVMFSQVSLMLGALLGYLYEISMSGCPSRSQVGSMVVAPLATESAPVTNGMNCRSPS